MSCRAVRINTFKNESLHLRIPSVIQIPLKVFFYVQGVQTSFSENLESARNWNFEFFGQKIRQIEGWSAVHR